MRNVRVVLNLLVLPLMLVACVPTSNIKDPLTARPEPKPSVAAPANGAIFQAGVNDRPMFEDKIGRASCRERV